MSAESRRWTCNVCKELERRYLTKGLANATDSIDWGSVAADGT